jgi:hypothetical protein
LRSRLATASSPSHHWRETPTVSHSRG